MLVKQPTNWSKAPIATGSGLQRFKRRLLCCYMCIRSDMLDNEVRFSGLVGMEVV